MGNNAGFIFITRCKYFLNKLNYAQVCVLLDLVRQRKKRLDSDISKGLFDTKGNKVK